MRSPYTPAMRIAQIAPLIERVPPKRYGGTERVVHALTEELIRRGHEVTLFATGDSETSARLISPYARSLREARFAQGSAAVSWTLLHASFAYEMRHEFDVMHDHLAPLSLPIANLSDVPVVVTMHGPFVRENRELFRRLRSPHVVAISEAQARGATGVPIAAIVHNGLPLSGTPLGREPEEYLLYVGRLSMEKGVHHAIDVALELDMPLIIAAKLDDVDHRYYAEFIEPRLSDRVRWVGDVDQEQRDSLMSRARCMLHPALWREPFGLTLIEAMACGCPVVAFGRGSIPEIVRDGVSGFVVSDSEEMADAVLEVGRIDRAACRAYALEHFSAARMADGYEALYARICRRRG